MIKNDKIKDPSEILEEVNNAKKKGSKIGFTNGCFDIIHAGHVRYLRSAKDECDVLIVGMNSDSSVKSIKGDSRPINSEWDRMEVLAALECVDLITLFEEDTPQKLIEVLGPDVLFKGGDWKEDEIAGAEYVKKNGGSVRIIGYENGYSTTNTIEKMKGSGGAN